MILTDTDVFIEALKNNPNAIGPLREIGFENIALSAVTLMELYFGARNKRELGKIKSRLSTLHILQIDENISKTATQLVEEYAKSHGLQIPDALIAATAMCHRLDLLTFNVKDFKFIDGISLYQTIADKGAPAS